MASLTAREMLTAFDKSLKEAARVAKRRAAALGSAKSAKKRALSGRMDMRALVGRNAKRLREKKGLTQEQFGEISGFSQQYISGLERGDRNPTVITLYELATAFGVSPIELLRSR